MVLFGWSAHCVARVLMEIGSPFFPSQDIFLANNSRVTFTSSSEDFFIMQPMDFFLLKESDWAAVLLSNFSQSSATPTSPRLATVRAVNIKIKFGIVILSFQFTGLHVQNLARAYFCIVCIDVVVILKLLWHYWILN